MAETSILDSLPSDVRAQLQQLLAQQAMQARMSQQAFAPRETQMLGRVAARPSPAAALISGLTGYIANRNSQQVGQQSEQVLKDYQGQLSQEMQGFQGLPEVQKIAQGRGSRHPQIQRMAEAMAKERNARLQEAMKGLSSNNDPTGMMQLGSSGAFPAEYKPPVRPGPEFGQVQGPNGQIPYATTTDAKGAKDVKFAPAGTNINMPGNEGNAALDMLKTDLAKRQERAQAAKESLGANNLALEALNEGAKVGGLGGFQQAVRKVAQGFGLSLPETAPTEQVSMALGTAVLAKARALAPVTGEDVKRLEAILGSVNTDPAALMKMLSVYNGIAAKELQDYNRYVTEQKGSLKSDYARSLFGGAGIGYEMQAPGGTPDQSIAAIAEMQKRGGDPSAFNMGGTQFPKDATFDLKPLRVPGQNQTSAVAPADKILDINQLTPAQKAELRKLLGQ